MSQTPIVFDETRWQQIIQRPDWYLDYVKLANEAKSRLGEETAEFKKINKQIRHFFEEALAVGRINLGLSGPDWDAERQPIDTIVIHHTSAEPGYRLAYMNATQLLNIYATYFANPYNERNGSARGQPIWSGHFKDGQQIFWAYQWLMRMDGSFERLLDDNQIGWHAGNWNINKRSVGICLDNDYEKQDPTNEILQKLAGFIKENYPGKKIIGHSEARQGTICPGVYFLDGWKNNLINYLHDT